MAERLGEISLDSMAIYRGMDVGTAKPAPPTAESFIIGLVDANTDFRCQVRRAAA